MNFFSVYEDRFDLANSDAEFVVITSKSRLASIQANFATFGFLASEFLLLEDLTPDEIRHHIRTSPTLFSISGNDSLLPYLQDLMFSPTIISDFLGWKYTCSYTPLDFYPPAEWKEILDYVEPNEITSLLKSGFADEFFAARQNVDDVSIESLVAFETVLALHFKTRVPRKSANYYTNQQVQLRPGDIVIDCGACANDFGGQFVTEFAQKVLPDGKVIALEPIPEVFEALKKDTAIFPNVVLFQAAVWKNRTTLQFISDGISSRRLKIGDGIQSTSACINVLADTIDAIAEEQKISFIKMDVEGSEIGALQGAEKTIRRDLPDLSICLYHKPEDFLEIPKLIRSYSADYKMYLELNEGNPWAGMKVLATVRGV